MKKIDLGQAINTLANVGVIAGIVFLGFELRQNQTVGRAATRNDISVLNIEMNEFQSSQALADLVFRSDNDEPLSPEEAWQLRQWLSNWLVFWENVSYQYRNGLYDESEYQSELEKMKIFLNRRKALRTQFCIGRSLHTLSSEFVVDVERLLDQPCPSVVQGLSEGDIRRELVE